jgi:hypothetical protein
MNLFSFSHPPNVKARSENQRQQKEDGDQDDETIPQLFEHCQPPLEREGQGRDDSNLPE